MYPTYTSILNHLSLPDEGITEIKNRVLSATSPQQVFSLLAEIKTRIDLCIETQSKEDKHHYYLLRAYCYMVTGEHDKAINSTTYAIDGFRVCGLSWAEVIGHWFLGTLHATQKRGYLSLAEIKQALDILEPIQQEFLIKGDYEEVNKCTELKNQLEYSKNTAQKMGTGPLYMPSISTPATPPASSNDSNLLIPWLPKYHSVRAGPFGLIWAEPTKEHSTFVHAVEIDGTSSLIHSTKGIASHDHKITLNTYEQYGWAKVEGHSMNISDPTPICHGDYILFRVHNQPQDKDIVVASRPTPSGEFAYMVKRFRESEKILISETNDTNENYSPVELSQDHQILGIVIAVAKPKS